MKNILLLIIGLTISSTFAGEVKEIGSSNHARKESLRPISKAIKNYIDNRLAYKEKFLSTPQGIIANLNSKDDQNELKSILLKDGDIKIVKGIFQNETYIVDLGKFKIRVEPQDFSSGIIRINSDIIHINKYKSLKEIFAKIDNIVDRTNHVSYFSSLADLIISSANASDSNDKYKNILKINSLGVISLTVNNLAFYRNDSKDFGELLADVEQSVSEAKKQCDLQRSTVKEADGSPLSYFGVLNDSTRKNLQSIVDKNTDTVTEEKLLEGILSKYAVLKEHDSPAKKGQTCISFFGAFSVINSVINPEFNKKVSKDICPEMQSLTSCLSQLYEEDSRVSNLGRTSPLKQYSGEIQDSGINYLDQIRGIER